MEPGHQCVLPLSLSLSSQSRSLSEGALGRENNDTCCSRGHNLATLLITIHPRGTHSSERHVHIRNEHTSFIRPFDEKMAEQLSMPPTVKFDAPGQRESISCQIEITQVLWQNAVVFLSAKRHRQQCSTEKTHCFQYIFHPSVILPAPMRASSFSLQVPSRQNARQPHQACSLTPQEKSRPVS